MALLTRIGLAGVGQRSLGTRSLRVRWTMPVIAADGTTMHMTVCAFTNAGGVSTITVLDQGNVTAQGGVVTLSGTYSGTNGEIRLAFVHNWDLNTASTSIFGGAGLATFAG